MDDTLNIQDFQLWNLANKLYFFDGKHYTKIKDWKENKIISFFKFFITSKGENKYIIQKALASFVEFALLGIISNRQVLNLLIDETNDTEGIFIQLERLKSLFLFYELEPISIIEIFEKNVNNDQVEIKSESLFCLGLIHFLNANKENNEKRIQEENRKKYFIFQNILSMC